ncbi:DEAD/DEAH box helicase [Chloroflexota bacterium]
MIDEWEGWHLHHLAQRAKVFGIDKPLVKVLERSGWLLTKDKPIPASLELEKALVRLATIKDFDKSCDSNCPICIRVVEQYSKGFVSSHPWTLDVELYRWQKEAKERWWDNNGKGIVRVVTGAGKTILAFSIMSDLHKSESFRDGNLRTVIIVPTVVLSDQWLVELTGRLNVPRREIAILSGKEKDPIDKRKIIIYVINSAREQLAGHVRTYFPGEDILLVADECHRYGSKENSRIFELPYSYTLGLSATPERFGDLGFETKLVPNLGEVIYSYSYSDALKDRVIQPYKLIRLKVNLTKHESQQYELLTNKIGRISNVLFSKYPLLKNCGQYEFIKKIGQLYAETGDNLLLRYTSFLNQRKGIIHTSASKLTALKWLIDNENLADSKVLVFHERIEIANEIFEYLEEKGYSASIYHMNLPQKQRIQSIDDYRSGKTKILVSCRALDEGFDVPKSEVGIIVAGTSSVRQWIQRMGRILRRAPDKEFSRIFVVFVDFIEKDVFQETELREFEKEALSVELISLSNINN